MCRRRGNARAALPRCPAQEDVAQQVKRLGKEALFAYDAATNTVEATVGRVKSQFCTEPEMRVGQRVPAVLKGPEMNITVSLGNCSLTHDGRGKAVACTHPSVSFVKVRAVAAAAVMAAARWGGGAGGRGRGQRAICVK